MCHIALMLLFSLLAFQLTNVCWAHEFTPTAETFPDPSISSDDGWSHGDTTSTTIDFITYPVPGISADVPVSSSVTRPTEIASPLPRETDPPNPMGIASQPAVSETTSATSGSGSASGNTTNPLVSVGGSTTLPSVTDVFQRTNVTRSDSGTSTTSGTKSSTEAEITSTCDPSPSTPRKGLPPAVIGAIVGSLLGAIILGILFVLWIMKRKGKQGFKKLEDGTSNNPPVPRNGIKPFILPSPEPQNSAIPNSKQRAMQQALRPISPLISPVTSVGESCTLAESILSR